MTDFTAIKYENELTKLKNIVRNLEVQYLMSIRSEASEAFENTDFWNGRSHRIFDLRLKIRDLIELNNTELKWWQSSTE